MAGLLLVSVTANLGQSPCGSDVAEAVPVELQDAAMYETPYLLVPARQGCC